MLRSESVVERYHPVDVPLKGLLRKYQDGDLDEARDGNFAANGRVQYPVRRVGGIVTDLQQRDVPASTAAAARNEQFDAFPPQRQAFFSLLCSLLLLDFLLIVLLLTMHFHLKFVIAVMGLARKRKGGVGVGVAINSATAASF